MPPSRPSLLVVLVGIVLSTGIVGLVLVGGQSKAQPHVGHNAAERLAAIDGVALTAETVVDTGSDRNRSVQRIWMRYSTGELRAERTDGGSLQSLTVSNGSVVWVYDPQATTVTRLDASGTWRSQEMQAERIQRLFDRLNVTRPGRESERVSISSGVSPAPVVPAGTGQTPPIDGTLGVTYRGTDTVDGRQTYVLHVETPPDRSSSTFQNYSQTLYVDTEWFLPLRTHTEWTTDGEQFSSTTTIRNVTFNPDLDDSLFAFDPPENATVETVETPGFERYGSVETLRANTSTSVPEPEIPPSFEFRRAWAFEGNRTGIAMEYTNVTARLIVRKSDQSLLDRSDGQPITLGETTGRYHQTGSRRLVSYRCEGSEYSVSGSGLGEATLRQVAGSLPCT